MKNEFKILAQRITELTRQSEQAARRSYLLAMRARILAIQAIHPCTLMQPFYSKPHQAALPTAGK